MRQSRRQPANNQIQLWADRTTVEGVPNLLAAKTFGRKAFWLAVLVVTASCGIGHMALSIKNFVSSGVYSQMIIDASAAEFPDVTICSTKPVSESLLKYYGMVLHQHLDDHWAYFDAWLLEQRRQAEGETHTAYRTRVMRLFSQLLEILWISDDTRDLSLRDKFSIFECTFNGQKCDYRNFTLVQHYEYWNCLLFRPHPELRTANSVGKYDAGLSISIFSDNNFLNSSYKTSTVYRSPSAQNYRANGMSLRQFLTADPDDIPLNSLLAKDLQADGLAVILHPSNTYPMHASNQRYVLQSSMAATYRVLSVVQNKLHRVESPCREEQLGHAEYTVEFGNEPSDVMKLSFVKVSEDLLYEKMQHEVYQMCRCYSHRIPFQTDKSHICYYVPPQSRKLPTAEVLSRINCHDRWAKKTLDNELEFAASHKKELVKPCKRGYIEVQADSTEWPSEVEIVPVTILYFVNWLAGDYDTLVRNDSQKHHIFNFSNQRVRDTVAASGKKIVGHETLAIRSLLYQKCDEYMANFSEDYISKIGECLNANVLQRNVMKVNVRLDSIASVAYNDTFSYDVMEILSDTGGVLGLWFGISMLTVFEFVELFCLLVSSGHGRQTGGVAVHMLPRVRRTETPVS